MQIYIEALDNFLGKLKFLAMGLYGNIGVEVIDKKYASKEAAEKYNKLYYNEVEKRVLVWRKSVEEEQMKLDSPEQYIMEVRVCEEFDKAKNEEE